MPEEFNHHFTSIGRNLAAKFSNNMPEWSLPPCGHKFKMPQISHDYVSYQLDKLSDKSNTDNLRMDSKLLKLCK